MFTIGATLLVGILESVTRIQGRESAVTEVTGQSTFVMQRIQQAVREASMIEDASSSLRLRTKGSSKDPTIISLSGSTIYISEGSGATVALTNSNVTADTLSFTKISNAPGKDVIQIDLVISYNTANPKKSFTKTLRSAIARVSAATFDSDLLPGTPNLRNIGATGNKWLDGWFNGSVTVDGNLTVSSAPLFVNSSGVGIGVNSPASQLQVASSGYIQIGYQGGAPASTACDTTAETGRITYDDSNNRLYVCDGTGGWRFATTTL